MSLSPYVHYTKRSYRRTYARTRTVRVCFSHQMVCV